MVEGKVGKSRGIAGGREMGRKNRMKRSGKTGRDSELVGSGRESG